MANPTHIENATTRLVVFESLRDKAITEANAKPATLYKRKLGLSSGGSPIGRVEPIELLLSTP